MTREATVIIIGSGPAGAAAALQLCGQTDVMMLDVGNTVGESAAEPNRVAETLGENLEGISHISQQYLSPKLRSPFFRYVTDSWRQLSPVASTNFRGELSLALGGLANAWGSGLYEFDDADLKHFPFCYSELQPFYLELTRHIGISGAEEDTASLLGSSDGLLPPLPLAGPPKTLYSRSQKPQTKAFLHRNGIAIMRQRLGILTQPHLGRPAYLFDRKDFFQPWKPSIYHPGYTVRELQKSGKLDYRPGILVKRFEASSERVQIHAVELATNTTVEFSAKHLLLGAGAINSARIVLESFSDYSTKLPVLENPVTFVPFVELTALGTKPEHASFSGAQLALLYEGPENKDRVQGSFYSLSGVLAADFFYDFPFSAKGNLFCLSNVAGAMGVLQLFYSSAPHSDGFLRLTPNKALEIKFSRPELGRVERKLICSLRRLGFWSAAFLIRYGEEGGSFHYAGTLPMREGANTSSFSTDRLGKLNRSRNVFVIDASCFPFLPAKNLSLTIMANAMRIASSLKL